MNIRAKNFFRKKAQMIELYTIEYNSECYVHY